MSRVIDPEGVLTEDEIAYLTARGREDVLARNAAFLINRHSTDLVDGDTAATVEDDSTEADVPDGQLVTVVPEPAEPVNYKSLNKPELVELVQSRGLETDGTKEELIARLEESDGE